MFRSLQWRLTLYFLLVLLLTNLVMSVFFYFRWQSNRRRDTHEHLLRIARNTANLITLTLREPSDWQKITPFLRARRRGPFRIIVFDRSGQVLGHNSREESVPVPPGGRERGEFPFPSRPGPPRRESVPVPPGGRERGKFPFSPLPIPPGGETVPIPPGVQERLPEVLSGKVQDVYWESSDGSESQQHLLIPLEGPPRRIFGAVYAGMSMPRFPIPWRFWGQILIEAVLVSGLFGFLLSRGLSRPVRTMAAAAEAIAAGDLGQRIAYRSRDELGQLAEKFNFMATRVQELVATLSDERDQLQQVLAQLQESERRRDELVANVSHELRTPLACIQGCVEALVDGVAATPDREQQCLHTITDEVQYLSRLVNDLLNLARASLGQLDVVLQPTDLAEVARQTIAHFTLPAERSGVSLQFHPPSLPPGAEGDGRGLLVQADPGRIAQVLTNLLDNALRHTPSGGQVRLTLTDQEENLFVTVEDTGAGIPKEELPSVFERFYRADRSRTRGTGGSGLGLAIAREIVRAHGGDIWIESEPGRGTKVGFHLPLAPN